MGIIMLDVMFTICMPVFFSWLTFFKINFFKNFFEEHHQNVKQFGSKSGLFFRSVEPDMGPNYLQYHQQTATFTASRQS